MLTNWRKKVIVGAMAVVLALGGLAGCGDGVDQDNGISDGQLKDEKDVKNP
ncbi:MULTISPECIES: hypothetical protein [unclassified Paenibacillus]|uniref:hypothetical protein n=1 Tax=unclassified Paenibacillus TaxID=185978 RepID=UPI001AE31A8E|nr:MULTISPECIES: hypothetical protein [unclassified Paenibacillus]MBP1155800.1 hypothetical protein [Paenibacillus sp. PvP091]MBP1168814.1 hypothetical protein [Paenibacillus sp. PvR098]MBP2439842.1 hypothetical protein [Paenibacillus sp. PvP052]